MYDYTTEWQLDPISFRSRSKDVCNTFGIDPSMIQYHAQQDEDKYVIQYLLKEKITDGVFLEVGACDGLLYSNTKTLEDHFGFSGILIEPQLSYFKALEKNRPDCKCYNYAVTDQPQKHIHFGGSGPEAMVSPLEKKKWYQMFSGQNQNSYTVKNISLKEIIKRSGYTYIDLMFIDVEGGELGLLRSMDPHFPVYCLFVEAHSDQLERNAKVHEYLIGQGFSFIQRQRGNEVWINEHYIRRHLFAL